MATHHNRSHQSAAPIDSMDANLFHIEETNKLLSNLETKISNLVSTKNPTSSINQSSNETEPTPYHNRPNPYKNESRAPYTLTSSPQNFKGVRRSITAGYDNSSQNEKGHINVVEEHNEEIPKSHIYSSPAHISSLYGASPIKNDDFHEISRHDFKNSFKLRDEESQNDRSGFIREPIETFGVAQREDRMENIREAMRQRNLKRSRDGFLDKMGQMEKFYKEKVDILEEKLLVYEDELKGNTRLFEDLNREIDRLKADLEDSKRAKRAHEDTEAKWTKKEQEWNVERKNLEKEVEQIKKSFKETTTEKEELEKRYEGLLKVQREMVQLDMEKNEKHLKSSAAKTEERNIIENEKILGLMDMIEQYKQEVEFLKENNNLLRKQLGFEIEQLKEELVDQKMENRRLSRRAKNESMNSTMSGESKREGSKKREEEGKITGVRESGNYVKEWGNYYPQGEGKGLKSSAHHRVKSSLSKRNEEGIRRFEEREDGGSESYEGRVGIRREKKHGDVKSIS